MSRDLLRDVRALLAESCERDEALATICGMIRDSVPNCDWVGFYLTDPQKPDELVLGPFVGAPTEHTRIPFGRGICGQAAARRETIVVDDVCVEGNYLSCSPDVKSEIVIPLIREGRVLGELDIDSHKLSAFGEAERKALEEICGELVDIL